ncbi:barstar family protein [Actinomycetota bacterium Odt1-20B]
MTTALLTALRGEGWSTYALDLAGVRDKAAFMARCARDLALPDWFGRNWDALADCLTDLSWAPPARGRLIVVSGWQEYADAAPQEWGVAREVLTDAVAHWRDAAGDAAGGGDGDVAGAVPLDVVLALEP